MIAAVLALIVATGLGGDAMASQSIDPCYKACFINGKGRSKADQQDCNRRCRASDRYVCDNKCFRRFPNSPRELLACRRTCVGLPGGW